MTQTHVTESEVVNAAKKIAARGEIPTIAAVRELCNGRGSETTILNYLRKWKIQVLTSSVYKADQNSDHAVIRDLQQQINILQRTIKSIKAELETMRAEL